MAVDMNETTNSGNNGNRRDVKNDPCYGVFINMTFHMKDQDGKPYGKPVRFRKGIAVTDLTKFSTWEGMDPVWEKAARQHNEFVDLLREQAIRLKPSSDCGVNLDLRMYRRQQEEAQAPTPEVLNRKQKLQQDLFGGDEEVVEAPVQADSYSDDIPF